MSEKPVTIYDVAMVAGVTVERVRLYYRRAWKLPLRYRRLIADAARGLGYIHIDKPDGVNEPRHKRVVIISPYVSAYSFVERIKGVSQALPRDEYDLITYSVEDESQLDRYLKAQARPGMEADGVILMSLPLSGEIARIYTECGIPLVSIELDFQGFPSITVDNAEGGRLAVQHFLDKGYKKPAFMGDSDIPVYAYTAAALRFQGYREALDRACIGLPESRIAWHSLGTDSVPEAFIRLMRQADPPDALFCASDAEAVVACRTSWSMDIAVPSQLAILGFDNLEIADFAGISSVDQFLLQSGRDAAGMLMEMMAGRRPWPADKQYKLKIAERIST